jgi:hypothetical protein
MRAELQAIKAVIEIAMENELDLDESVPIDVINKTAELHQALARLEKEGA